MYAFAYVWNYGAMFGTHDEENEYKNYNGCDVVKVVIRECQVQRNCS